MSINFINDTLKKEFNNYLNLKDKQITTRTRQRYLSDISFYIARYMIDDVGNLLNQTYLKNYLKTRRSSTARASITNLLNCLRENRRISDNLFYETTSFIQNLKKSKTEQQMEFLQGEQLAYILSNRIEYSKKNREERILLPLIVYLAYKLIFEQDHLIRLKWSDIDLVNMKIRNIRSVIINDGTVSEWISIDQKGCELIKAYQDTVTNTKNEDAFLVIDGRCATNNSINSVLSVLKRKANINMIKTSVDIQKINRSRILKDLMDTNGKDTIEIIKILGLKRNTQLEHALEEFLLNDNSKMPSDIS